jgi:hypothetical protein
LRSPDVEEAQSKQFATFLLMLIVSTISYGILWWLLCFLGMHLLLHKESQYPGIVYQAWFYGTFVVPYLSVLVLSLRAYRRNPTVLAGALAGCVLGTIFQAIFVSTFDDLSVGLLC